MKKKFTYLLFIVAIMAVITGASGLLDAGRGGGRGGGGARGGGRAGVGRGGARGGGRPAGLSRPGARLGRPGLRPGGRPGAIGRHPGRPGRIGPRREFARGRWGGRYWGGGAYLAGYPGWWGRYRRPVWARGNVIYAGDYGCYYDDLGIYRCPDDAGAVLV